MKKFILVALAALFVCSAVDAQIMRADELEKLLLSYHGLLSSEEVQRNHSHPSANFCRLSFCLLLLEAYW